IENKLRTPPKPDMIKKLAKGLNENPIDLMAMAGYFTEEEAEERKKIWENSIIRQQQLKEDYDKNKQEMERMRRDLYFLLNKFDEDIYYKDKLLTSEDKTKILTMLQTILE